MSETNGSVKPAATLLIATSYVEAGLSVVPIKRDGSKLPSRRWKCYEDRLATEAELLEWYDRSDPYGIATLGGRISGNLEQIDFDQKADTIFPAWCELVDAEAPGLLARLSISTTPRPGSHVRYRCTEIEIPGNTKLAEDPSKSGKERTLIETRGEGGYALAPGTPPECHPNGRTYQHTGGPFLTALEDIAAAEREILLRCARSFNLDAEEQGGTWKKAAAFEGRPGDDFNRLATWPEILEPHGWAAVRKSGSVTYWKRPDKEEKGWSATTGYCSNEKSGDLLAVFSSNAHPFDGPRGVKSCSCYSKFSAYALLNHKGDFKAAASELKQQGYGEQRKCRKKDSAKQEDAAEQPEPGQESKANSGGILLGKLCLVARNQNQTASGKITVAFSVLEGAENLDIITLSSAASGRKEAARRLAALVKETADADAIDKALGRLLVEAAERLRNQTAGEGPTLHDLLVDKVPETLRLTHRTAKGLWSEAQAREIVRSDFITHCPNWLITEMGQASDAPRAFGGASCRLELVRQIGAELAVLWSDLMGTLPQVDASGLSIDSEAARLFRVNLINLWTATRTFEIPKGNNAEAMVSRASLMSRVRTGMQPYFDGCIEVARRERWRPVHPAFAAWWRPYMDAGAVTVLLAMRAEVAGQIGIPLDGVKDQRSLLAIGKQYGVFLDKPPVSAKTSSGKDVLAILAPDLVEELMSQPLSHDPDEEQEREPGVEDD